MKSVRLDRKSVSSQQRTLIVFLAAIGAGLGGFISTLASAQDLPHPVLTDQVPATVFVPKGFDSNDNAQVILDGSLINTCYKSGPSAARVDINKKRIVISNQTYVYPGDWCAQIQTPDLKVVDLGILLPGKYSLFVRNGNLPLSAAGQMEIMETPNPQSPFGPDDYLYAPVSDAFMQDPTDPQNRKLVLRGVFPDSCMTLGETRVKMDQSVIVVLPIAQHPGTACNSGGPQTYESIVDLSTAPKGKQLIHVRSMNGKSLNRIVNFQ